MAKKHLVAAENRIPLMKSEKVFYFVNGAFLTFFLLLTLYPLLTLISQAISDPVAVYTGRVTWYPIGFSLEGFKINLTNANILLGFKNTAIYTFCGTALTVCTTLTTAFALSRRELLGRSTITLFFAFTMWFSGGLIPTYLLISNLGMLDTIWAILLPGAFSVWNMIIARTYYQGVPRDLEEAASIDGASEMVYFFKILLPVCTPIIATICMWQFVGMWNSYFDAMIYLNDVSKQPLQLVLRGILIQSQPEPGMVSDMQSTAARAQLAELLKYATIIISSLPLLIMYPFFQRYFDSGIMAGAVKG